ncbi:MAG: hypothetical protein AB7I40_17965 [Nocardioides sp.]
MYTQLQLAQGIQNGRVHSRRDSAQIRNVELALESERRARRARRSQHKG